MWDVVITELCLVHGISGVLFEPLVLPLFLCDFVLSLVYIMVTDSWYLKIFI